MAGGWMSDTVLGAETAAAGKTQNPGPPRALGVPWWEQTGTRPPASDTGPIWTPRVPGPQESGGSGAGAAEQLPCTWSVSTEDWFREQLLERDACCTHSSVTQALWPWATCLTFWASVSSSAKWK